MYEITDRYLAIMKRKYIRMFSQFHADAADFDELNILKNSKKLYQELLTYTKKQYLKMAKGIYEETFEACRRQKNRKPKQVDDDWLDYVLSLYDDVAEYIFFNEVDRKQSRFAESVVASENSEKAIKTALRLWSNMVSQFAISVSDEAALKALKDAGYRKVEWHTEEDEKVCDVCKRRNKKIYPVSNIPKKPHWNCRCWVTPL